jgi:alpha-1,2-mannosyltransferase
MDRARDILRSGAWLTRERIRLVAIALLIASAGGFLYLVATAHGGIDLQGRPLGTDFSNVYAAGTYVLDGNPAAPFDPPQQFAREQAIFGAATQFYGWHYPPFFLFVAAALAWMPYGVALAVWQAVTLGLYLLAIRAILSPSSRAAGRSDDLMWLLLALAFPAVLINVGHGQNGFLTAALLGGALVALDRRPFVAGILLGLLVYKPQYGIMIPIALAAGGHCRSFAVAAATVAVLALATTLVFGPPVWHAFFASTEFTRTVVLEQGNTGWYKIQSVFSWARMWDAPIPLAYAIQGGVIVALGAALTWLWRSGASFPLKAAALCLATILATPYSLDYDMMVLAPAIAFLTADGFTRGFGPWQKTALAALWLAPLLTRSVAQASLIPLGVPAMLAMFVLVMRYAGFGPAFGMAFAAAPSTMEPGPGGTARGHDIAAFKS